MKVSEVGDSIHGHRTIADARKVSDPVVIVKSGRHKAQRDGSDSDGKCIVHN